MKMARASSGGFVTNNSSGLFSKDIGRVALLAGVFSVGILVMTGCSSTGGGVKAALIAPVASAQQESIREDDEFYQPPRSPGFNDLNGS
jgi:hypothetical protein